MAKNDLVVSARPRHPKRDEEHGFEFEDIFPIEEEDFDLEPFDAEDDIIPADGSFDVEPEGVTDEELDRILGLDDEEPASFDESWDFGDETPDFGYENIAVPSEPEDFDFPELDDEEDFPIFGEDEEFDLPEYDDDLGDVTAATLEEELKKLDPDFGIGAPETRKDGEGEQELEVRDRLGDKDPEIAFDEKKLDERQKDGKGIDEEDPEFNRSDIKERKLDDKVDPFKSELDIDESKEDGEGFDRKDDAAKTEFPNSPKQEVMASNIVENPANLTVSAIEACPEKCHFAAKITNHGQKAILFAVTNDGNYLPIIELNRNLAGETFGDFFTDQKALDRLIFDITKDGEYRPSLKDFAGLGGRDFQFKIPTHKALNKRIEDGISNVTASMKRDDEEVRGRLEHSLKIAALECIKRIREDVPNEVRENLVSKLKGYGIEDAASIVDNTFRESGEQFVRDLLKRTKTLSEKSDEVRNEAAENAAQAKFKREEGESAPAAKSEDVPNHAVAASLSQGSTPIQGMPVTASSNAGESDFMRRFGSALSRR